jgi:hypothetical protein
MSSDRPHEYDAGYGRLLETRVRIATWNLWGRYGPWEARLPAITETLRRVDADVVGLQEVWEDDRRSQASERMGMRRFTGSRPRPRWPPVSRRLRGPSSRSRSCSTDLRFSRGSISSQDP